MVSFARTSGPYAGWCEVCVDTLLKRCRGCGDLMPKGRDLYCGIACRVKSNCSGTEDPLGCWLWKGAMRGNGYGVIRVRTGAGQSIISTPGRAMFSAFQDVPAGMAVVPTCKNRSCCNFLHLTLKRQSRGLMMPVATGATFRAA